MIILIRKSELFMQDPDARFSREHGVSLGLWKEMWRRYSILGYTIAEMSDYFELKTHKRISNRSIKRWIMRTRIHVKVKPVADKGCEVVNSEFFDDLEWFVLKELYKNIKSSGKLEIKALP